MSNKFTLGYDANPKKACWVGGDKVRKVLAQCDIAVADADGDTIIVAHNIPVDTLISAVKLPVAIAAITAATDYDLGFYQPNREDSTDIGTVIDKDALVDGIDFSGGVAVGDILEADRAKTIGEILGLTVEDQPAGVHIAWTLNTAGSATGLIGMEIDMICAG